MSAVDIAIEEGAVTVEVPDVAVDVSVPVIEVEVVTSGPPGADGTQAVIDHEAKPDPHPQYATDAALSSGLATKENTGVAASLDASHVAAPDPHPQYLTSAELAVALPPESDANSNTSYGVDSQPAPTGWDNTALGANSQRVLTSGSDNVAVGYQAQHAPKGNSATGTTTASGQVAVGQGSGAYLAGTGGNGVSVGTSSVAHTEGVSLGGYSEAQGVRSVAIGYQAVATSDNQIMLGTAASVLHVPGRLGAALVPATSNAIPLGSNTLPYSKTWTTRVGNDSGQVFIDDGNGSIRLTSGLFEVTSRTISQIRGLLFQTDNTYDIGQTAALRPRDVHVGRALYVNGVAVGAQPPESDANGNTGYGIGTPEPFNAGALDSTALGKSALAGLTTGDGNTAVGSKALESATTGLYNIGIGYGALRTSPLATTTQNFHVAVGTNAGAYAGAGDSIVAIGTGAVANTGAVALGTNTEARGTSSVAIGSGAIATLNNQVMLGTASQRVDVPGTFYVKGIQVGTMLAELEARLAVLEARL